MKLDERLFLHDSDRAALDALKPGETLSYIDPYDKRRKNETA